MDRLRGKSFGNMIKLRIELEKGLNCAIATHDPEKAKKDFKYITGEELTLEDIGNNVYSASIKVKLLN